MNSIFWGSEKSIGKGPFNALIQQTMQTECDIKVKYLELLRVQKQFFFNDEKSILQLVTQLVTK